MSRVRILDCTLRDGGYCNQWMFGKENIHRIINGLLESQIEIIECGFLNENVTYQENITKFNSLCQIQKIIPIEKKDTLFVCMMNYGDYDVDKLPEYDGKSVDGIRVAFHKKDMEGALEVCRKIKEKGYQVFIQGMVSLSYSDNEFLELIERTNEIEPYAFYIVDSFGVMKRKDLIRFFFLVEHNLKEQIKIGYHSHNNMQLAYSNAQALVENGTVREIIIDSSTYGMGRGAGNLNTELFVEYLNDMYGFHYKLQPLLQIIDEVLNEFYQTNYWGYSLPNYLSAKHNIHPNYASYLDEKKTLAVSDMNEIFAQIIPERKGVFSKDYIENLYQNYQEDGVTFDENIEKLKGCLQHKKVLVIAPGKTVEEEKEKLVEFVQKENVVVFSINFDYQYVKSDYVFISNLRRYKECRNIEKNRVILTSNIKEGNGYLTVNYGKLLNDIEHVKDNAALMCIQFLLNLGVEEIYVAGIDGYSYVDSENYVNKDMKVYTRKEVANSKNKGLSEGLQKYGKQAALKYVTTEKYVFLP